MDPLLKKSETKKPTTKKQEKTNLYENTQCSGNMLSLDLDLQRSKARDAFACIQTKLNV